MGALRESYRFWQTPQVVEIEDQLFAGLVEQGPEAGVGVLAGEGTQLQQGALALVAQAQQGAAQLADLGF